MCHQELCPLFSFEFQDLRRGAFSHMNLELAHLPICSCQNLAATRQMGRLWDVVFLFIGSAISWLVYSFLT